MCAVALAPPRLLQTTHPAAGDRAAARELERELLIRYHEFGDLAAREELVRRYMPFARKHGAAHAGGSEPTEDLIQVAIGLVKAIDRYDPERGTRSSPTPCRRCRRAPPPLPRPVGSAPPARAPGAQARGDAANERGGDGELGRSPTAGEIAAPRLSQEDVLEALQAAEPATVGLTRPARRTRRGETARSATPSARDDPGYERVDRASRRERLAGAPRRERSGPQVPLRED